MLSSATSFAVYADAEVVEIIFGWQCVAFVTIQNIRTLKEVLSYAVDVVVTGFERWLDLPWKWCWCVTRRTSGRFGVSQGFNFCDCPPHAFIERWRKCLAAVPKGMAGIDDEEVGGSFLTLIQLWLKSVLCLAEVHALLGRHEEAFKDSKLLDDADVPESTSSAAF